ASDDALRAAARQLKQARPTAVNLTWAIDRGLQHLLATAPAQRASAETSRSLRCTIELLPQARCLGKLDMTFFLLTAHCSLLTARC
ncbi:hypothetical protein, partial [Hymenobacter sp.]|uniref:hypothetical protein n=1 Tax=Hymenobacter sp. TaxID=1898978 RepID=UPI00286BB45F